MTEKEPAYPKFSDFNTNHKVFDGKKISIESILNNEILIKAFKIGISKFKTKEYATIQFNYKNTDPQNNYIVFTGSGVVIDQLNQNKEHLPFFTTIRKIDKYYTLS